MTNQPLSAQALICNCSPRLQRQVTESCKQTSTMGNFYSTGLEKPSSIQNIFILMVYLTPQHRTCKKFVILPLSFVRLSKTPMMALIQSSTALPTWLVTFWWGTDLLSGKQILSSARLYRWINSSQCCRALQGDGAEQNYLHNIQSIPPLDLFHREKILKQSFTQNFSDTQSLGTDNKLITCRIFYKLNWKLCKQKPGNLSTLSAWYFKSKVIFLPSFITYLL